MAVYTPVSGAALDAFLAIYDIGALIEFEGVLEGVENSNFRVSTQLGRFILTVFERRVREADLPFFFALMTHAATAGVPVPRPVAARDGEIIRRLEGKPAAIVTFLDGACRMQPSAAECREAGVLLGRLHRALENFPLHRKNDLGLAAWRRLASACKSDADRCAPGLGALIEAELAWLGPRWPTGLPVGAVHADFFPDNVFFDGDRAVGVIDFYFACTDALAYDLAIAALAFASIEGRLEISRARAFVDGYATVRALSPAERSAGRILMRGAAVRFLLTRLFDWINQVDGAVVAVKDPLEYRNLLLALQDEGGAAIWSGHD